MKNNIAISEKVISNKLPFGKQGVKHFICFKDLDKIRRLGMFRREMIIYKRNFDEYRHKFFY